MRHDQIFAKDSYDRIDIGKVAAVWPARAQVPPLPLAEADAAPAAAPFLPTPSCPDVPVGVGKLIVAAYVGLIAAFAAVTVGSAYSLYMITISALFLVAFFTVPILFLAQEPKSGRRPSFERFMAEGMGTLTGHCSGNAALVQMLIVPVSLTMGVLIIGLVTSFLR